MEFLALGIASFILGVGLSTIAEHSNQKEKNKEYEQNKNYLEQQFNDENEKLDALFAEEKAEANKQADKADFLTDKKEIAISDDINLSLDNLFAGQEQQGFANNIQAMQAGQQKGNELASAANSGIRSGSSVSQAIELEASVNAAQLQQQEDTQRRTTNNQLGGILNNLSQSKWSIWDQRDAADNKRLSYEEGGYAYNNMQINKTALQNQYELRLKQLDDDYNNYMSTDAQSRRFMSNLFSFGTTTFNTGSKIMSLYE